MPAFFDVRVVFTKFNFDRIKQCRVPLSLGAATLLGVVGLGMILGLLGRTPESNRARPSPPAAVTVAI
ncbi:MAG: hypothetical protein V1253_06230, partial [Alphaproteobacteria bacterium]|nr:hypothetical protein [Alphaproteobacteria bacterium]